MESKAKKVSVKKSDKVAQESKNIRANEKTIEFLKVIKAQKGLKSISEALDSLVSDLQAANEAVEALKAKEIQANSQKVQNMIAAVENGKQVVSTDKKSIANSSTMAISTKDKLDLFFDVLKSNGNIHYINAVVIGDILGMNVARSVSPYLKENEAKLNEMYPSEGFVVSKRSTEAEREEAKTKIKQALKAAGLSSLFPKILE